LHKLFSGKKFVKLGFANIFYKNKKGQPKNKQVFFFFRCFRNVRILILFKNDQSIFFD